MKKKLFQTTCHLDSLINTYTVKNEVCKAHQNVSIHTFGGGGGGGGEMCVERPFGVHGTLFNLQCIIYTVKAFILAGLKFGGFEI